MNTPTSPHHVDPLLAPPEAAQYLGIKVQTLESWRCNGRYNLPFVRVGRCVRYRTSALAAFVEANTVRVKPEAEAAAA